MKKVEFAIASFTAFKDSYKKKVIQNNIGKTIYEIDVILEEMYIAYINKELNVNVSTLEDAVYKRQLARVRWKYQNDLEFKKEQDERSRSWAMSNRNKVRLYQKKYQDDNKDKVATWHKEYYASNKERLASRQKEYYASNKEKIAAQRKEYYAANKGKVAAQQKEYRAAKRRKKEEKDE